MILLKIILLAALIYFTVIGTVEIVRDRSAHWGNILLPSILFAVFSWSMGWLN